MAKRGKMVIIVTTPGAPFEATSWVEQAFGNRADTHPIDYQDIGELGPLAWPPRTIRCEPVPGRHGIDYVQDWSQLTHFG